MGLASMIVGIVSVLISSTFVGFIGGIVGLVLGLVDRGEENKKIAREREMIKDPKELEEFEKKVAEGIYSKKVTTAGITLNTIAIVFFILFVIFFVFVMKYKFGEAGMPWMMHHWWNKGGGY